MRPPTADDEKDFPSRLRYALEQRGKTPYWLEQSANVGDGLIYRMLSDNPLVRRGKNPSVRSNNSIAEALNVDDRWLSEGQSRSGVIFLEQRQASAMDVARQALEKTRELERRIEHETARPKSNPPPSGLVGGHLRPVGGGKKRK